jgi:hypothetical protein
MPRGLRCQAPDATWMGLADHANLAMLVGVALIGGFIIWQGGHAAARRNAHGRLADAGEPELRGGRTAPFQSRANRGRGGAHHDL